MSATVSGRATAPARARTAASVSAWPWSAISPSSTVDRSARPGWETTRARRSWSRFPRATPELGLSGGVRSLLAPEVLHLLAGVFELRAVPHLLDAGPDVAFLFLDVVLERQAELADLLHPGVIDWLEPPALPGESFQLRDFPALVV